MADPETLEQFLRFLSADRPQPDDRFVILWNHGAGYVGYGLDENFRKLLTLEELDAAFSSSGLPKLDMVASEETEPSHGWNYRFVVPAFLRSQSLPAP